MQISSYRILKYTEWTQKIWPLRSRPSWSNLLEHRSPTSSLKLQMRKYYLEEWKNTLLRHFMLVFPFMCHFNDNRIDLSFLIPIGLDCVTWATQQPYFVKMTRFTPLFSSVTHLLCVDYVSLSSVLCAIFYIMCPLVCKPLNDNDNTYLEVVVYH